MSAQAIRLLRQVWPLLALVFLIIAIALAASYAAAEVRPAYGLVNLTAMAVLAAIEPITVTIPETMRLTGQSRSAIYESIGNGELTAVKDGARTLIVYASIKQRQANLPRATIKAPKSKKSDSETEETRPPP